MNKTFDQNKYASAYRNESGSLQMTELSDKILKRKHLPLQTSWYVEPFDPNYSNHSFVPLRLDATISGGGRDNPVVMKINELNDSHFRPVAVHIRKDEETGERSVMDIKYEAFDENVNSFVQGPKSVIERMRVRIDKNTKDVHFSAGIKENKRIEELSDLMRREQSTESQEKEVEDLLEKRRNEGQWVIRNHENSFLAVENPGHTSRSPLEVSKWIMLDAYPRKQHFSIIDYKFITFFMLYLCEEIKNVVIIK